MILTRLRTWAHQFFMLILIFVNVEYVLSNTTTTTNTTSPPINVIPGLGVNWGKVSSHRLSDSTVARMLKDNGIKRVKLFDSDSNSIKALAGTGIEVMVGIPNDRLRYLSDSYSHAKDWVQDNVSKYMHDGGVDIRYVAVGNEPFLTSYNNSFINCTFPALQYIQRALEAEGFGDTIKATIPLNADVYNSPSDKPSDGIFRNDIKDLMLQIVKFFQEKNSPFVVNIYPFLSLYQNIHFPFGYAFFDDNSRQIQDKNVTYTNVFDANYDTLVWTLNKAGFPDIKILVGEVGWPTDGHIYANPNLAKKFYDGLIKKLAANKGTPLRPGRLDVYLFSLIDEDQKSVLPGNFERHWGIFRYDGQPKFPVDLSGKGNDKLLISAKDVQYLPNQWCVFDSEIKNMSLVPAVLDYACSRSDCTSLGYGSSCNGMDLKGNVSYAFNMYFQMNDQDVEACDFNGMATIVKQNASMGNCLFPVQIVSDGYRVELTCVVTILLALCMALLD